jgi:hypothetical protein
MSQTLQVTLEVPDDIPGLRLPHGVQRRLTVLLDRRDQGYVLTPDVRLEAEGLVNLAERLTLLRLRAERGAPGSNPL